MSPPGLQAERTVLAWDRTALGLLATGALLLRDVTTIGALLVPACAALLLSVLCALIGRRRARRLRAAFAPPPVREVAVVGGGVVALGLLVAITTAL